MWYSKQSRFISFFIGKITCINNDRPSRTFARPFAVTPLVKKRWAESENTIMLASETITRWCVE